MSTPPPTLNNLPGLAIDEIFRRMGGQNLTRMQATSKRWGNVARAETQRREDDIVATVRRQLDILNEVHARLDDLWMRSDTIYLHEVAHMHARELGELLHPHGGAISPPSPASDVYVIFEGEFRLFASYTGRLDSRSPVVYLRKITIYNGFVELVVPFLPHVDGPERSIAAAPVVWANAPAFRVQVPITRRMFVDRPDIMFRGQMRMIDALSTAVHDTKLYRYAVLGETKWKRREDPVEEVLRIIPVGFGPFLMSRVAGVFSQNVADAFMRRLIGSGGQIRNTSILAAVRQKRVWKRFVNHGFDDIANALKAHAAAGEPEVLTDDDIRALQQMMPGGGFKGRGDVALTPRPLGRVVVTACGVCPPNKVCNPATKRCVLRRTSR
jgi:hypothetical protein